MMTIDEFLVHINNFAKTDMTGSEANTKKRVIEPLLEFLGWNLLSNGVRLEYPVRIGTSTTYVDYALSLEDKPVVLVEAKAYDEPLSEAFSSQIISYGKIQDIQWTVLTNGKSLRIFDTRAGRTEEQCLVVEIDLQKLPTKLDELKLLSRESILTGEIEKTAKRLSMTRNAITKLKSRQEEIAEAFKKILLDIAGIELENRVQNISNKLAKQTVELFEEKAESPITLKKPSEISAIEVATIPKEKLLNKMPGEVVLCSSRLDGVEFLKKYNAWGFVNISTNHNPRYLALYVGKPHSSVLYFGEIESITRPLNSKEEVENIQREDLVTFETGKRVIHLKTGSLSRLDDAIPLRNMKTAPRGLRYTTIEKLAKARYVEDL